MANVSVWNASGGVVKVGQEKVIVHPGQSVIVTMDDSVAELESKGMVAVSPVAETIDTAPAPSSKKKKETQVEALPMETEADKESSEDSILPKETD